MDSKNIKTSGLTDGPIPSKLITEYIKSLSTEHQSGALAQFLGQVRADEMEGKSVAGIEYSAYAEMAEKELAKIREEAIATFEVNSVILFHSVGKVRTGEISLMILISSGHSKTVYTPLQWLVDQVKARVPIWKKEWFEEGSTRWVEGKGTENNRS